MKPTVIQIPDPVTTKSVTFHEYKAIMAVYYMGELNIAGTDAAYLAMTKGRNPPGCICAAFRAWRNSANKPVFANTVKKIEAADSLYEVLLEIDPVTTDAICKITGLGKNAVRTYLAVLIEKNLVTRNWEQQKFLYSVVPQPQENEQVAA